MDILDLRIPKRVYHLWRQRMIEILGDGSNARLEHLFLLFFELVNSVLLAIGALGLMVLGELHWTL